MNVLPLLQLLLMQLLLTAAAENQTAKVSNATAAAVIGTTNQNNNNNGTGTVTVASTAAPHGTVTVVKLMRTEMKSTKLTELAKVNNTAEHAAPVLARKVTNTDTATSATTSTTTTSTTTTTTTTARTPTTATVKAITTAKMGKLLADGVSLSDIKNNTNANNNSSSSNKTTPATNSSSSSSSSTSTTTTTTTTMRPSKPKITYSMFVPVEGENDQKLGPLTNIDTAIKQDPLAQPVQQLGPVNRSENEYIVPIVTVMLTVPIAIAIFIIVYKRFRDLWSTRHYRRMDFLVDGMYND